LLGRKAFRHCHRVDKPCVPVAGARYALKAPPYPTKIEFVLQFANGLRVSR